MNINSCKNKEFAGFTCAYRLLRMKNGEIVDYGCSLKAGNQGNDHYNIYPEFDPVTKDVVFQPTNSKSPYRLGEQAITWESLTQNQNGKTFNYQSFNDIHPLYHEIEYNIPTNPITDENVVGEIMGELNPSLVSSGWNTTKFVGIPKVEICNHKLYGKFNKSLNMVSLPFLYDYFNSIKDWVNYTTLPSIRDKKYFIDEMNKDELLILCYKYFKKQICNRIVDTLLLIKNGHYIDIKKFLEYNLIDDDTISCFIDQVSFKTKSQIFKKKVDIQEIANFYNILSRMSWTEEETMQDGTIVKNIKSFSSVKINMLKSRIINWLLNNPKIINLKLYDKEENKKEKFNVNERYWFLIQLLKRSLKEGILKKNAILPEWLMILIRQDNTPKKYNTYSEQEKDDYFKAKHLGLSDKNKLYPTIIKITDIINKKGVDLRGWDMFCNILRIGEKWNQSEIKETYDRFIVSWIENDPSIFFDWIEEISSSLHEDVSFLSPQKLFAINILEKVIDFNNWNSWDDWEAINVINNWGYDAKIRLASSKPHEFNHFWKKLAQVRLKEDDQNLHKVLSDSTMEEAYISYDDNLSIIDRDN